MNGKPLESDSEAENWTITELGLEREGLRANHLAINAKMNIEGGTEEDGMAGVYITHVPIPPPIQK
jgi:ribosomal protein S6E (S10)